MSLVAHSSKRGKYKMMLQYFACLTPIYISQMVGQKFAYKLLIPISFNLIEKI